MIVKNNHLKEAMVDLNGELKDKNKEINNLNAFVSGFEGKIVKKNNGVIKKDQEISHVKTTLRSIQLENKDT